jgi:hypothetical protein
LDWFFWQYCNIRWKFKEKSIYVLY